MFQIRGEGGQHPECMCLQKPVFCFKNKFWIFGVLNVLKGGLTDLVLNSDTEAGSN